MAEGNPIKYSDLIIDDGAIEKAISKLTELEKKFKKSQESLRSEIEKTRKTTASFTEASEDQEKQLSELEKQLEKLLKANKDYKEGEEDIVEAKKRALKLAKEEEKLKKKLIELDDEQTLLNEKIKLDISEKNKQLKEQAKREKGLINAYDEESKRLNQLRREYKALAVQNKQNTIEGQALLRNVTELDEKLKAIDKSVGQTQRQVGNYKDQVKEALAETGLWNQELTNSIDATGQLGVVIGGLQTAIGVLTKFMKKETNEVDENTVAVVQNETAVVGATRVQRAWTDAVNFTSKAFKGLNGVLKATGIGILIAGLASLVSFFKKTQEGSDSLAGGLDYLEGFIEAIAGRLAGIGKAIVLQFESFTTSISAFFEAITLNFDEAIRLSKESERLSQESAEAWDKATDGILEQARKAGEAFREIGDRVRQNAKDFIPLREQMALLNAESEKMEEIEGDNTKSFKERTDAILKSIDAQKESSKIALEIARRELEVEQLRVDKLNELGTLQTSDREALLEKRIGFIEAEKEADIKALALRRVANQLNQDLIEKNLDILIDGFDNQKTINERLIADEKRQFEERRNLILDTQELSKKVLAEQVAEIQKVAKKTIDINDLVATADAKVLNEKIRAIGLSEILEGRLLEVIRESRTQELDLNEALRDVDQQRLELKKEINQQLEDLRAQNIEEEKKQAFEIQRLNEERAIEELETQKLLYKETEEEFKKLDASITEIKKKGIKERQDLELEALKKESDRNQKVLELRLIDEGKTQEEINKELTELKIEQLKKEIELEKAFGRDSIDAELELAKLQNQVELDAKKKQAETIQKLQDTVAQAYFDAFQKQIDRQIAELDRLSEKQLDIINRQEQRAIEGVSNTLAFEEGKLAELEQKKLQAQKKQLALDKARALYSAYSSASASGDNNAIVTVLRDFAILEGIESLIGSFGHGTDDTGTFEDALSTKNNGAKGGNSLYNGVFRGESHKMRGKGIPVFVERNEGLWSAPVMNKFGKDNFVRLTQGIKKGEIGSNILDGQSAQISQIGVISPNLSTLTNEMKLTRKAIENKPTQEVDVMKITDSVLEFVEKKTQGSKRVVNRYQVKKGRI